jgi:hypothetical protein
VHEVEDLTQVPAETIEGVRDDRVTTAGVGQQRSKAVAVDAGAGLLVGEDPLIRDPGGGESVELAFQALLGRGDPGVRQVEPADPVTGSGTPLVG